MPKTSKLGSTADAIAERASRGEDVSSYFTNEFTVVRPIRRVNVDLTQGMLPELEARAARLNVSRQAVIKTLLAQALNETRDGRACSEKSQVASYPRLVRIDVEGRPAGRPFTLPNKPRV